MSKVDLKSEVSAELRKEFASDTDETITIRIKDLRDVLHDAIGDVLRYTTVGRYQDVEGPWCRAEDVDRLEAQIATSLIDERLED